MEFKILNHQHYAKGTAVFSLLIFFIWILPLGAFIKPYQEEKTCGGKRAICLCSKLIAKRAGERAHNILLKRGSNASQEKNSSQNSPHFLLFDDPHENMINVSAAIAEAKRTYQSYIKNPDDPVPKA